jgi:hypothetical protein
VALEEPLVGMDIELGLDIALAILAAVAVDMDDPSRLIPVIRSIISMGGAGSWALPCPYISPRAQASRSS